MKKSIFIILFLTIGCVFKFEVPAGKTKLEQQILGYKPLISTKSLRKIVTRSKPKKTAYKVEQINKLRDLLRPQILSELKKGTLGERKDGKIQVMQFKKWLIKPDYVKKSILIDLANDENEARIYLSKIQELPMFNYSYSSIQDSWYQNDQLEWKKRQ